MTQFRWIFYSIVLLITGVFLCNPALTEGAAKRTALIIGNSNYKFQSLDNPQNDATDMAAELKRLGFDVILKKNADKKTMVDAFRQFGRKLSSSEIGLFYFAGHGMQVKGVNYLIPVKHGIEEESEVEFYAVDAGMILAKMESAGNPLNIVILDACRDNPFKRSFRSSLKGLARMDAPDGTIIAYATKSGSVAADGKGRNGTYTAALLNNLENPDLDVRDMFKPALKLKEKPGESRYHGHQMTRFPIIFLPAA